MISADDDRTVRKYFLFPFTFKGKTNNDWSEQEHFEKVPGKYDMVMRDFEATADDEPDAVAPRPSEPIKIPESKLSKPVQSLERRQ
ncbi:hypothetical protein BV898_08057 [Hypsibius exemplaris]|uniref:Uncharacterized protein n=1 Tax=Hypsibius exemplaris TaxID=2072580 RepID=A0A1W0WRV8_HYPEX|nr:hypothetical protein BV898_08057 [Hypsibius exemplaris]